MNNGIEINKTELEGVSTAITPESCEGTETESQDVVFNTNEATYCPEDDKLRLYVGRVPREEYLALKKEGWKSTPMQDCDFVATWTPKREATALSYADEIGDEDQSPSDRAVQRAERFGGYLDKRRAEAHELAGTFNSSSPVHGYQNHARAQRAANRHDRIAGKACTQWEKAEYWQQRTAGVISNALYKSSPSVRLGRIKKIEKEIRQYEKAYKDYSENRKTWIMVSEVENEEKAYEYARTLAGNYKFGDNEIYDLLRDKKISGKKASEMYLEKRADNTDYKARGHQHLELRLAYENQMIEAVGGKAGAVEMKVGGKYCGKLIFKVNKSAATKLITSITTISHKTGLSWYDIKGTQFSWKKINVERATQGGYTEPTEESINKVKDFLSKIKMASPKKPSLINPTNEDAERLQLLWNQKEIARRKKYQYGFKIENYEYSKVIYMTQKACSERSKGTYSIIKTNFIGTDGHPTYKQYFGNVEEGAVCKIRYMSGKINGGYSIVVITDKPQKSLPDFVSKSEEVNA